MNNPQKSLEHEIPRIAGLGCDFIDLTLEPPGAWPVDPGRVRALLDECGLSAVGHTAYYLPIGSAFPEVRQAARDVMRSCLRALHEMRIDTMNIHPHWESSVQGADKPAQRNAETIADLADYATELGIKLMIENGDYAFADVDDLAPLLDKLPGVGFHLDVGHANLFRPDSAPIRTDALLRAFGDRLTHVHVHDNHGGMDDTHLPLGAGSIDWEQTVASLRQAGWDGTVTLEVFTEVEEYVATSVRIWRQWWAQSQEQGVEGVSA